MKNLEMVPENLRVEILEEADRWGSHVGFGSTRSTAKHAVAEYIANTNGYTIFTYMVGKPNPLDEAD